MANYGAEMGKSQVDPDILEKIKKLVGKVEYIGQDLSFYLDGLLHSDYPNYWDYIQLYTLLSGPHPKTNFLTKRCLSYIIKIQSCILSWYYKRTTKISVSPGVQIGNTCQLNKVIFYRELWTVEELEDWGRSKVLEGTLSR